MAFVTLEEVKDLFGISGTSKDTVIQALLEPSQGIIETYCERKFLWDSHTDTFDIVYTKKDTVILQEYPVRSVAALSDDGSAISSGDFHVYPHGKLQLTNDNYFTQGVATVQVTYVSGYQLEDLPSALKWACKQLVHDLMNNRFASMASEKIENYTYKQAEEALRPEIKLVLDQFKRGIT